MTIEQFLEKLGGSFRGLWTSYVMYDSFGGIVKSQEWSVTIALNGDFVETPGYKTPKEAFKKALKMKGGNYGNTRRS